MNIPASSGGPIVALALTPPDIPRKTYPIKHQVADVGLSRLNYYADPNGLLVLYGPYLGQVRNETGRLYLNGLPVPTPAQTTVDSTSPLEFRLPPGLLSDGVNSLKVSLQRQSGNEDSSELRVLHSLVDPAGNDTDPNPGNSLLSIDVTPKSIGPAEAAAGVKVTMSWPGMALYDLLTIYYGGQTLTHQLVPTAQDPNPHTKPVVLTFNAADFAHAPNDPQFIFKYNVKSQIDDFSGTSPNGVFNPQKLWSKDCLVDVHLSAPSGVFEDWEKEPERFLTVNIPERFASGLAAILLNQPNPLNPCRILAGFNIPGLNKTFVLGSGCSCRFSWGKTASRIEFITWGVTNPGNGVDFYNSLGQLIGSTTLPTSNQQVGPQTTTFNAADIAFFIINAFQEAGYPDTGFSLDQVKIELI